MKRADATTYGWDLPKGWHLEIDDRYPDGKPSWLVGIYFVDGCNVHVRADLRAPISGPREINITETFNDPERAFDRDGITLEVLRSVPLGDARKVLAEWLPRMRAALFPDEAPKPLPERVETLHDYARVAEEYARLVNAGERRPIHVMAEASGVSRNTMSARVRRARDMGLLIQIGKGTKLRAELSAEATNELTKGQA
ncbi:hypothetical protein [Nonomuraea jabiensis]|uniref:hypothetical protein n=1 Tax=Nonomuraea jabiensis TaxID=882448 RepID=UPI0036BEFEA2